MAKHVQTDTDRAGSVRVGILCNPSSGRNRKRLDSVRRAAAEIQDGVYIEASSDLEIGSAVDAFAGENIDLLVMVGGDGTVHATLNHIFGSQPFAKLPLLTVIPGGTTNMTALDLGLRGNPDRALVSLKRQLQKSISPATRSQQILRIEQQNAATLYGMFFGAGIIAGGVKLFTPRVQQMGINSEIASGIEAIRYFVGQFLGRTGESLSPVEVSIRENESEVRNGNVLLVFATVLDRLLLGMRPYWGQEESPIHVTLVRQSPRRLWRSLPSLLTGRGARLKAQHGYHSRNLRTLELDMEGSFVIDGELYRADNKSGPVRISTVGPVNFLLY